MHLHVAGQEAGCLGSLATSEQVLGTFSVALSGLFNAPRCLAPACLSGYWWKRHMATGGSWCCAWCPVASCRSPSRCTDACTCPLLDSCSACLVPAARCTAHLYSLPAVATCRPHALVIRLLANCKLKLGLAAAASPSRQTAPAGATAQWDQQVSLSSYIACGQTRHLY